MRLFIINGGHRGLIKLNLQKRFNAEHPMSHAGLILGLHELEVERVDRNDAISVYAKPKQRPCCIHFRQQKKPSIYAVFSVFTGFEWNHMEARVGIEPA